jgi:phenylacetate-CoA ligase
MDFKIYDKKSIIWNYRQKDLDNILFNIYNYFTRRQIISVFQFSKQKMKQISSKIQKYNPKFIIGYATALYLLAKHCIDEDIQFTKPKTIFSTSSKLLKSQKTIVEKAFNCQVYDWYASREMLTIAAECPYRSGLHIASDHVLVEFVKNGEQVGPGEGGSLILTNLHNYSMPFIRYDIGDFGKYTNEVCSCGRGLPLIESLEGRNYEIFLTSNGSYSTLRDLDTFFENIPVKEFQIIQKTHDEIHVKIVKDKGYNQNHTKFIKNNLIWGGPAKIVVEIVDSIPFEKSGKKKYLVSKIGSFTNM